MAGVRRAESRRGGTAAALADRTAQCRPALPVSALQEVFNDYPEYAALYHNPDWDDASWVAQRWLEVLPIPVEQKQWLLAAENNLPALSLLSGLLVATH